MQFRLIRGDGNCAPRSILLSLLDNDPQAVFKLNHALEQLDADDEIQGEVKKYVSENIHNSDGELITPEELTKKIQTTKSLDIALMLALRMSAIKKIKLDSEKYKFFLLDGEDATNDILEKPFAYFNHSCIEAVLDALQSRMRIVDVTNIKNTEDGHVEILSGPDNDAEAVPLIVRVGCHYISGKNPTNPDDLNEFS